MKKRQKGLVWKRKQKQWVKGTGLVYKNIKGWAKGESAIVKGHFPFNHFPTNIPEKGVFHSSRFYSTEREIQREEKKTATTGRPAVGSNERGSSDWSAAIDEAGKVSGQSIHLSLSFSFSLFLFASVPAVTVSLPFLLFFLPSFHFSPFPTTNLLSCFDFSFFSKK